MRAEPIALGRRRCDRHAERAAVGLCASCGRAACLACAVPVRGSVLCGECARREVGDPTPSPEPAGGGRSRLPDLVSAALLGVALLASLLPWERFGTLTAPLSAWRPGWTLAAELLLVAATGAAGAALLRRWPALLGVATTGYPWLAGLAAAVTAVALLRAPDFASPTPVPFVVLAAGAGAALIGSLRPGQGTGRPLSRRRPGTNP